MKKTGMSIFLISIFIFSIIPVDKFQLESISGDEGWATSASKNWLLSNPVMSKETTFSEFKNSIPSPYGEFDPLSEPSPIPNFELPYDTDLMILQLETLHILV